MKTMLSTIVCGLVLGASTIVVADTNQADQQARLQALESKLAAQQAEIQQLRAANGDSWLNERRTEEVKALVRDVLSDADTRASLAEGGMTAGHNGKHFFLASEDGGFLMNISGQIQFRWLWNSRDDGDTDDVDANETGFVVRRAKIEFHGHIADPRLKYYFRLDVDSDSNEVYGDIITISYDLTDTLTIKIGEDKAPFMHEELVSSRRQLAVERSAVNELYTLGVVQGIFVDWDVHEQVHLAAAFHDGGNSGEPWGGSGIGIYSAFSDFDGYTGGGFSSTEEEEFFYNSKDFYQDNTDFAITARVDVLLAGDWKQNSDFTSWSDEELFVRIGGAVHYEVVESGQNASGENIEDNDQILMWTIDGAVEYRGLSFFAAFVMAHTDFEESSASNYDPWAVVAQISYNIALNGGDSIEPFFRWEHFDFDGAIDDSGSDFDDEIDLLTVGVNWYHNKHNAKFTADVVWALDPIGGGASVNDSGLGLLSDGTHDADDQFVVRLQYQLLF